MEIKLAEELKNAGFPQLNVFPCDICNDTKDDCVIAIDNKKKPPYQPTLEQLIEACGSIMFTLNATATRNKPNTWCAFTGHDAPIRITGLGSTPTEAVSRLWLALNKTA